MAVTLTSGLRSVTSSSQAVGMSVSDIANDEFFRDALNLRGDVSATVNGSAVEDGYVVADGDSVEFERRVGTKG